MGALCCNNILLFARAKLNLMRRGNLQLVDNEIVLKLTE